MTHEEFTDFVQAVPGLDVNKRGWTLFSSINTLKKGKLYILGFNPGEDEIELTIGGSLEKIKEQNYNEYKEDWGKGAGNHPIQKNVHKIAELFDLKVSSICASNLIFERSHDQNKIAYNERHTYWPIHKKVIEIVQPELIIAFGNGSQASTYHHLKEMAQDVHEEAPKSCGHGHYQRKYFTGKLDDQDIKVIGLPHLSWYSLYTDNEEKKEVLTWMKGKLG